MYSLKRMAALLAVAAVLAMLLPGVAAAAGSPALAIDTVNRYDGMDKAWGQGYLPSVSHGKASVVLPLVLDPQSGVTAVADNSVTVKPDYGDPSSSPFVFSNLETTVKRTAHGVNGTAATVKAWLLKFSFSLESHRTNGRYPLVFHVSYALADGTAQTQDFTVYVTIKDGINPYATPKPAATPKPQPQPKLIVSRYEVKPGVVQAGSSFTIDFDVKNTSDTADVRNIKITLKGEGTDLEPAGQTNTLYLKDLAKSATASLSFDMKAAFDAEPKPQKVAITIDYEDGSGTAYTAGDDVLVQLSQAVRIEFDKPNIPAAVNAGDTVTVNLNVFNMGRTSLNNVLCKVSAPGLLPEGSAFLGNMEPGASETAEIFVCAGTLDMSLDGDGNIVKDPNVTGLYGATSGFINVTYEDEFGNKLNQQVKLGTTIAEPAVPASTPAPVDNKKDAGQWWISVVVAGAVVASAILAMAAMRRRRTREVEGGNEAD